MYTICGMQVDSKTEYDDNEDEDDDGDVVFLTEVIVSATIVVSV